MSEACFCRDQCADCRSNGILPSHLNTTKQSAQRFQTLVDLMIALRKAEDGLHELVECGYLKEGDAQIFQDAVISFVEG